MKGEVVRVLERLIGGDDAVALVTVKLLSARIRVQKRTRRIGISGIRVAVGLHFLGMVLVAR